MNASVGDTNGEARNGARALLMVAHVGANAALHREA
jgi:hypothetical protein